MLGFPAASKHPSQVSKTSLFLAYHLLIIPLALLNITGYALLFSSLLPYALAHQLYPSPNLSPESLAAPSVRVLHNDINISSVYNPPTRTHPRNPKLPLLHYTATVGDVGMSSMSSQVRVCRRRRAPLDFQHWRHRQPSILFLNRTLSSVFVAGRPDVEIELFFQVFQRHANQLQIAWPVMARFAWAKYKTGSIGMVF